MPQAVILLVEDNPITRKLMRFALEAEGYDVVDAAAGRAALEMAATRPPDLLVLDYVLPDMDGLQLLAAVRRQTAVPELPAIIVTGMVSRLDELRAQGGAHTQFLAKPVAPSRLLEIVGAQLSVPGRPTSPGSPLAASSNRRVLVLDDEPLNRKLTSFRLKQAGYEVETASAGAEGLEMARRRPPDAILTDVLMPSMDGFAFCREARREPALASIPIVLVSSAYVDEADRELARSVGANALVVHTPDLRDATEALGAALRGAAPPTPVSDDRVATLHRERLQVQLERQTARNEALLRQAAIQAAALSIVRGLSEVLAEPKDITQILADVLVHCLDAAGLSTGLLYVADPGGRHRLQAQFGITADRKADAEACFGHPELIRRIVEARQPVAFSANAEATDAESRDFLARLGQSSVLILPFVVLGETYGELVLASDSHDLSENAWIAFARSLALQFGQTVALGQSLKRLAESEGRYRALMEQANDAIFILDTAGTILETNRQSETLLALPRDRMIGRHISDFAPVVERAENLRKFQAAVHAGGGRAENVILRRGDGTLLQADFSMSLNAIEGKATVLSIGREVTERRRGDEALRRSEARMKSVLDAALDAVIMMDEQGLVVSWNARAEDLFGLRHDDAIGRSVAELIIPPRYRADHARGLKAYLATGEGPVIGRRTELSALRRDGSEFPIELTVTALKEAGAFYFNAFVADITDRKRAEQEIAERMELATFTSDIGAALIRDEPLPVVLQQCAEAMMRHLEPAFARIWTLNHAGDTLELQASAGMYTHLDGAHARVPVGRFKIGLIAAEREPHLTNDVVHDPRVSDQTWAKREGMVAFAGYPLVVGDQLVGVMAMFSRHPLSPNVLGSMAAVANQIALGIERKRSEEEHLASEEQYRLLFDSNPHSMWVYDQETFAFLAVNDAALRHYGYSREEFLAMTALDIRPPEEVAAFKEGQERQARHGAPSYYSRHTFKHRKKSGAIIEVDIAANAILFQGRRAWLLLATDVTEKRTLEAQLLQSQKMESMGRLAGGVAHDFNNLLGIITGYGDLLRRRVTADPRLTKYVDDIVKAAERAAGLTRQLLAFSRQQVLQPRILDLNPVVDETQKMLRRVIGEDIQLVTVLDENLAPVKADAGQMDQILMNLAVNARDAMPRGGRLTIETANVALDESYARQHAGVEPGRYVMLAISDTGHGMTPEVRSRIFEPFFTTKDPGKGTGLGLATVHGIVKQSGGHIFVYSEPGHGTSFKIYLPRADAAEVATPPPESTAAQLPQGSETIVLVEDEESLRELIRECLETTGYTVLEARHGADALEICERHEGPVHLLITDVVMPNMSGRELGERVRAVRPDIRVLYMSGYTDDAVVRHGVLAQDMAFLQKPFTAEALARKVRACLETSNTPGAN